MNQPLYAAVTIDENGKNYSYIVKISSADNLISKLKIRSIISANVYRTKKEAALIVNHYNAVFHTNGTYLFDKEVIQ